jgi:hypothetical protein
MRRIGLAVVLILMVSEHAAEAQESSKVPRIGWLSIAARTPEVSHLIEAFSQGLREHGYVEGRNLAIEYRFAEGNIAGLVIGLRWLAGQGRPAHRDEAHEILRQRYARGEIDKQEFESRKRDLGI